MPKHGIVGAGVALVITYVVMLTLAFLISRRLFKVPFQWLRLAQVVVIAAALVVLGNTLIADRGPGTGATAAADSGLPSAVIRYWILQRR